MERFRFGKSGFSAMELVIAGTLFAVVVFGFSRMTGLTGKIRSKDAQLAELDMKLGALAKSIIYWGALAGNNNGGNCSVVATSLQCNFNRTGDPKATPALERYIFDGAKSEVRLEQRNATGVWQRKGIHPNIKRFDLCGETQMTANTCTLEPQEISRLYVGFGEKSQRYFRFRIVGMLPGNKTKEERKIQGGFFVRNPSPFVNVAFVPGKKL